MDNPIPDQVAGVSTLTILAAWIGAILSLAKQERKALGAAVLSVTTSALAAGCFCVLVNHIYPLPTIVMGAAAWLAGYFAWQWLPVLGDKALEAIRGFRFPWSTKD